MYFLGWLFLKQNACKVSVKQLLYMLTETLQLVREMSSLSKVLYKKVILKSFSKFRSKYKKLWEVFYQKVVLKNFAKILRKTHVLES